MISVLLSLNCRAALFKTHWCSSINTFNCFLWFSWLYRVAFQDETVFLTLLRSWVYPAMRARGKNESPTFRRKGNRCDYFDRARFLKSCVLMKNKMHGGGIYVSTVQRAWHTESKHTIKIGFQTWKVHFLLLKNKDVLNNKLSFLVSSWSEPCTAQNMAQLSAGLCNTV